MNVEDVDLENRRAVVHNKGGDIELLHFQAGTIEHGCDLESIVVYPQGSDLARWNCSLDLGGPDPTDQPG